MYSKKHSNNYDKMNYLKKFFKYILDKNVARHSQALSFATILCIVPIITIFIGFIGSSNIFFNINYEINLFFNSYLFPTAISDTFNQYFKSFSEQASNLKLVGIIFFIISILLLFSDMEDSFCDLLSNTDNSTIKKIIHKKATTLFTLFFAPIVLFAILGFFNWITSFNTLMITKIINMFINHNNIIKILIFAILWLWFSFLFYLLPRKKIRLRNIFIGSTFATIMFVLSQILFGYYISKFAVYELIYGVFSIVPIFFLWIYLNWQITLYSLLIAKFLDDNFKTEKSQDQAS